MRHRIHEAAIFSPYISLDSSFYQDAGAQAEGARPGWTAALSGALMTYVLLGLDRTRIVVDPDVANEKAIARFLKQGFTAGPAVVLPEVDLPDVYLPEKNAQLAFLRREVAFAG